MNLESFTLHPKAYRSIFSDTPYLSYFRYKGLARDLCLKIKIKSEVKLMDAIIQYILNSHQLQDFMQDVDFVVPVPSSLWGRIRGRIDFAGCLAANIASHYNKTFQTLPWKHYMRGLRKRAQLRDRKEEFQWPEFHMDPYDGPTALIVDDIVTTGYSMKMVRSHLPYHCKLMSLCLTPKTHSSQADSASILN
jgi:predicted amidophosphoribosyltransferase